MFVSAVVEARMRFSAATVAWEAATISMDNLESVISVLFG